MNICSKCESETGFCITSTYDKNGNCALQKSKSARQLCPTLNIFNNVDPLIIIVNYTLSVWLISEHVVTPTSAPEKVIVPSVTDTAGKHE